jgi:HK97 gp10 family phage protein
MRALPKKIRKRVARKALRKAAVPIVNTAVSKALTQFHGEGYMATHIMQKAGRSRRLIVQQIGVEGGGRKSDQYPYYWRFLEFGTSKMPARPFMRPAFEENKRRALDIIIRETKDGVEKEVRKMKKK